MIGQVSHVTLILLQLRESNVTIEIFELVAESEKQAQWRFLWKHR